MWYHYCNRCREKKNNDDAKKSNNKYDALGDKKNIILRTEDRLEALQRGMIGVVPDIKYVTSEYMTTLYYNHTNQSCGKNLSQSLLGNKINYTYHELYYFYH